MKITMNYLLILAIIWLLSEFSLAFRDRIQGKGKSDKDKRTGAYNVLSIIVSMVLAIFIAQNTDFLFVGQSIDLFLWLGAIVIVIGILIRLWAIITLGKSFRTTIQVEKDQKVVQDGPYKLIRHPSYAGAILICLGYGIAFQNWLSLLVIIVIPTVAIIYRIPIEEAVMISELGEAYTAYQKKTKKLVPFIW
jgi:protein-S-isoprenylcysteine O-methyltransferase Ste14